jgi:hypothetical protein
LKALDWRTKHDLDFVAPNVVFVASGFDFVAAGLGIVVPGSASLGFHVKQLAEASPLHVRRVRTEAADQPKDEKDHHHKAQHAPEPGAAIGAVSVISASAAEEQDKDNDEE